ncbi:unnamed protein product [Caenorhabditis nigoni]
MKKFIKSSQMNRFQSCSFIKYTCDYRDEPWICVHYGKIRQGIMRIVKREEDKNDYFQLNVSGKTIAFRFQRVDQNILFPAIENSYYPYPVAAYQPSEKESKKYYTNGIESSRDTTHSGVPAMGGERANSFSYHRSVYDEHAGERRPLVDDREHRYRRVDQNHQQYRQPYQQPFRQYGDYGMTNCGAASTSSAPPQQNGLRPPSVQPHRNPFAPPPPLPSPDDYDDAINCSPCCDDPNVR